MPLRGGGTLLFQAWHAWAVMNFEAVLHYKLQNQARDEKKKLRHASGTSVASANTEGSNSESEAESTENSPAPSPVQKKVMEVRMLPGAPTLAISPPPSQEILDSPLFWGGGGGGGEERETHPSFPFPPEQDLSKTLLMYTVPAVQGFFRSISLSRGNNLQDTLRCLLI